jgi:4-amino-4-deoxy-L-arabinose transferase-like glycosyltransferase
VTEQTATPGTELSTAETHDTAAYAAGAYSPEHADHSARTVHPDYPVHPDTTGAAANDASGDVHSNALTVEHALYALIVLAGFALRFVNLGVAPLTPVEAHEAWSAWLAATGTSVLQSPAPASALYYGLQSLLFFVVGANDFLARLLPALMGTALLLLPWWWRRWLGRAAALLAALLLALDPWLTTLARTAEGTGLTLFLGLLALTALLQWGGLGERSAESAEDDLSPAEHPSLGWERALAVSLGLLLVSGPQAWSWLPVLALFAFLYVRRRPRRSSYAWFGAALLLGASGLLSRPEGIGAVGASLTAWLSQWSGDLLGGSDAYALGLGWPFLRLLVDQLLLVVFGILGLVLLGSGRGDFSSSAGARRLALFLGLWLAWGIVLALLPGRSPFVLPMMGLPLLIAAAAGIAFLISLSLGDATGVEVAVLLAVAGVLVVAGSVWLAMVVESFTYDSRLVLTAALLLGLIALVWVAFGFWGGWRAAAKLAGLFFAGLLLLVSIRSGWMLNHPEGQMTPNGFFPVVTLPEARLLPLDMQRISSMRNNDPFEAPVQVVTAGDPPDPLVGWLLRNMRGVTWVAAPDPQPQAGETGAVPLPQNRPMVVAPYGMEQDRGLAELIGSKYPLTMRWAPAQLPTLPEPQAETGDGLPPEELARLRADQAWSQATRPQLEWLLYRSVQTPPSVDGVTLWALP